MSAEYIRFCGDVLRTITALVEDKVFSNDECIPTFCESLRDFYLSLFGDEDGNGFFPAADMNAAFERIPDPQSTERQPPPPQPMPTLPAQLPASQLRSSPVRRGTGKGRPGTPRKSRVTDRAKRKRKQQADATRKRQRILLASPERSPATVSAESRSPTPSTVSAANSSDVQLGRALIPDAEPGLLHIQVRRDGHFISKKRVAVFKDIAGGGGEGEGEAEAEGVVSEGELKLFFDDMCQWTQLDEDGKSYAQLLRHTAVSVTPDATTDEFLDAAVYLKNVASGIANAASRAVGEMLCRASRESGHLQSGYEAIQALRKRSERRLYTDYRGLLERCRRTNDCVECDATIEWDDTYLRYYASDDDERIAPPPDKERRPLHCRRVDPQACSLKSKMAGFSETALLRDRNFCVACPKDSCPVYSLALPTDVQALTVKYFKPFVNSWSEGQPLPPSFTVDCLAKPPENPGELMRLSKESVIFFDGDGGEVRRCPEMLTTHRERGVEVMRFRTAFNDAPEAFSAFRSYRKSADGRLIPLRTYHAGVESLRAARRIIASCIQVFLQLGHNSSPPAVDNYGRRLVNLWIQEEEREGPLTAFPVIMARQGFTHEYPLASEHNVQNAVKIASATRSGLRQMPQECMQYPYRPWDVRKLWKDPLDNPEVYTTEFQTRPDVSASQDTGVADTGEEACGEYSSYCRLVRSPLVAESYCYPAPSTIPGAGRGLFIRPRKHAIPKDSHLCLYARNATSEREIHDSGSSRVYAIQVGNGQWFDGEIDTGENIGRFANQCHLRETLELAAQQADKRRFQSMDWIAVNNYARSKANSHYYCVPREQQLVIRSSQEVPPSSTPIEVFTFYGDLQVYWLPLLSSRPTLFPPELVRHVEFLLTSEWSNLTEEEKLACSG